MFEQTKIDKLLKEFGGRKCKSDCLDAADIEEYQNEIWTWPISPEDRENIVVDDPPIPFLALYFDNCYHEVSNSLKDLNG